MISYNATLAWLSEIYKTCYCTKQLGFCLEPTFTVSVCTQLLMMSPTSFTACEKLDCSSYSRIQFCYENNDPFFLGMLLEFGLVPRVLDEVLTHRYHWLWEEDTWNLCNLGGRLCQRRILATQGIYFCYSLRVWSRVFWGSFSPTQYVYSIWAQKFSQ